MPWFVCHGVCGTLHVGIAVGFTNESRRVNVITAVGGDPSPLAAKRATSTIPIVFGMGGDPISAGLVESFNRPGGNATGFTLLTNLMEPKRLGLLRELAPGVPLFGALVNPNFSPAARQLQQIEEAARTVGQRIIVGNVSTDAELDAAFASFVRQGAGALLVAADPFFDTRRERIIALAARWRLPAILSVPRIRGGRWAAGLWREHHRGLSPVRPLHREYPQGGEASRPAGSAGDQVREDHQPQDRQGAGRQDLRQSALACRRGH